MKAVLMLAPLALGTAPAMAQSGPGSVAATTAEYNARFVAPTQLTVGTGAVNDYYAADSAALPVWLDSLNLTAQELRALAATVGTYAAQPWEPSDDPRQPSAAEVVIGTALAFIANNDAQRRGDMLAAGPGLTTDWPVRRKARPAVPPKDRLAGQLIAFDTCGGAFFAALTRLNQSHPKAPFTAFVRSVGGTAFSGPLPADPTCGSPPD